MKNRIKEAMSKTFEIPIESILDSISQSNCSQWDSLKHLSLSVALEETFNISLEPEEIGAMVDLAAVEKIIAHKIENPQ